jgi:outer membrane protein TolC
MASRNASRQLVAVLVWFGAAPLAAQAPAPVRLTFADAVRRAAGTAPAVELAGLRTDEAQARVGQARAVFLPTLTATAAWVNRDFNKNTLGIRFPSFGGFGLPTLIRPFNTYDTRLQLSQTLLDFSSMRRVRAARAQLASAGAQGGAVAEGAAMTAAGAYLRAARAAAVVAARVADSSIAADLVGLAQAQKAAGVSAAIDVTRARTQLVAAEGALLVARNQMDRGRIDLARSLGLDPAAPLQLADTLSATLPRADVPASRDSIVALALAGRPDLRAEVAVGDAARSAQGAIAAERLPRLGVEADFGSNGPTPSNSIGTGQVALQVSLPILDGWRRERRADEQRAQVRESEVRVRDLHQQIVADVDGALLDFASAEAQQAIAAERLKLANDELAQARERFKAGVAGNIEVIDAQSSLLRARDTDIDARSAAATARVALARAAGVARTLH